MRWLNAPFLEALANNNDRASINQMIKCPYVPDSDPMPILHWLVQFKLLRAEFNYCGGEDMVFLAMAAGADVNAEVPSSKCTPLFHAVKYSSTRTVELLLDAGANAGQRDIYGQSIWKNVVERPDPEMVEIIIKRCSNVIPPADEQIKTDMGDGISFTHGLPDFILYLFQLGFGGDGPSLPISWQVLGLPDIDCVATSVIRILQAGAQFSPANLPHEHEMRYLSIKSNSNYKLDSHPLSFVSNIDYMI